MTRQAKYPPKALFAILLALFATLTAQAQSIPIYTPVYHPVTTIPSKPWYGHSLLSLHIGTGFTGSAYSDSLSHSDPSFRFPFTAALRYAGEKYFAQQFFWGWQSELSFNRLKLDYTRDGDQELTYLDDGTPSSGQIIHYATSFWSLAIEERLSVGYDLSYYFSLNLSAGVYCLLYSGGSSRIHFTDKTTGLPSPSEKSGNNSFLNLGLGFCPQLELLYFLSDNVFLSCTAKAHLAPSLALFNSIYNTDNYALLLGIGYKSYNNHSHDN